MMEHTRAKFRSILMVDMSAFYAAVEQAHDPALRGKPVAIFGNPRKGFVITCSYEARQKGVHTLMYIDKAKQLCPDLIIKTPNFPLYKSVSQDIFAFLSTITPLMEPASIDEAYLQLTEETIAEYGNPIEVAQYIQRYIKEHMMIDCGIGISYNKFLAKFGSGLNKPNGITVIRRRDIPVLLWPRPIIQAHGVGEKSAELLRAAGYETIGNLANAPREKIKELLGNRGVQLWERVNGHDDREVNPEAASQTRTMSAYRTLPADTDEEQIIVEHLSYLCQTMSMRLKKRELLTQNIHLTIRYTNWQTITRSRKLGELVEEEADIFQAAMLLWKKHWDGGIVRLIGITVSDVTERRYAYKQLNLFSYQEEDSKQKDS